MTNLSLNPCFMKNIFAKKSTSYNLRVNNRSNLSRMKTVSYGIQSAEFLGISLWHTVPNEIQNFRSIPEFKNSMKSWKGQKKCPFRMRRHYVARVDFLT